MGKRAGWLIPIAISVIFSLIFWLTSIDQPLIDHHDFRQTQTALSSFYIGGSVRDLISYETPVLGYPWSIPFEFPLYQWITAHWHKLTGDGLARSGRLVSVIFSIGCVTVAGYLMKLFNVGKQGIYCFILLYFSSAIYLYWSRSFLIESTALFWALLATYAFFSLQITWEHYSTSKRAWLLLGLSLSLGIALITKATTAAPMLLLFGLIAVYEIAKTIWAHKNKRIVAVNAGWLLLAVAMSFLMLKAWTSYADSIKSLNPIGVKLTSDALSRWNFGTVSQRFSADLWHETILGRMITPLGTSSLILIGLAIRYHNFSQGAYRFLLISLALFVAPLLIFTNLHIAHSYYQYGNHIFLLLAVATSYQLIHNNQSKLVRDFSLAAIVLFIIGSYGDFKNNYFDMAYRKTSDKLKIGKIVKNNTKRQDAIIVFGDDWSSALAFHSQRYSLTLPKWPSLGISPNRVLDEHSSMLGKRPIGAIIATQPILDRIDKEKLSRTCKNANLITIKDYWHVYICR